MHLVEQHIVQPTPQLLELSRLCCNLYNQSLYYWRQSIFGNIQYFNEYELTGLFAEFDEPVYRALPAQTAQGVIKNLFTNIKLWQRARKEYTINPSKFLGKPKLPKYKSKYSIAIFTNQQVRLRKGVMFFSKNVGILPLKTKAQKIKQVRIIPKSNHFVIEIVHEVEETPLRSYNGEWIAIDMGLNNLATCVAKDECLIINGKPLKSINHYYNKRKSHFQSKLKDKQHTSRRINELTHKRNCKINDYLHKSANVVINMALCRDATKIVIGKNDLWKQKINIGRKNNRQFTQIPHTKFIDLVTYKAKLVGIDTVTVGEAYTSKTSALDFEPIKKHETYVGKRVKRGLFRTSNGNLINADANGALNIARLALQPHHEEPIFTVDRVLSCVSQPVKVSVLQQNRNDSNNFFKN